MQIAKIAVEAATYAIDKPYSYGVPAGMDVSVGCRVLVPFGRGNRTSEGIVLSLEECLPNGPLKALRLNLDGAPGDLSAGDQAGILDAAAVFLHVL